MKLLIVNKRSPFDGLGAEKVIWDIGRHFASEGHSVTYFCASPTDSDIPDIPNISFEFVETPDEVTRSQIEFFVRAPIKYRNIYKKIEPDLVYDNPSPFPFHLAHFYGDAPVVSKVHTIYRSLAFRAKDHPLVKFGTIIGEETYRVFNNELFTPVSQSTANRLRSLVNTSNNTIITNPNGTDTDDLSFSFNSQSKQVLYLSKLGRKKGVLDLLYAWKIVEESVPDASLVVAGSGPLKYKATELATDLQLENVSFPGYVSNKRKRELFAESLIYVLPTYIEGMPLTPLEAMASGCAVVSTDTYGVRDIITDGVDGQLVEPGEPEQLAQTLINMLTEKKDVYKLVENGKKRANELTTRKMLDREISIINDWLDKLNNYSH